MNKVFKYKGKTFAIAGCSLSKDLPGARVMRKGINVILLNVNLEPHKRRLELHRLITGRGLFIFKNGKRIKKCFSR